MGRTATYLLLRRIRGDTSPPRHVLLLTTFVERGSGEIEPRTRADPRSHGPVPVHTPPN